MSPTQSLKGRGQGKKFEQPNAHTDVWSWEKSR